MKTWMHNKTELYKFKFDFKSIVRDCLVNWWQLFARVVLVMVYFRNVLLQYSTENPRLNLQFSKLAETGSYINGN